MYTLCYDRLHSHDSNSADTRRLINVGLKLVHRLRWLTNVKPALIKRCFLFWEAYTSRWPKSLNSKQLWKQIPQKYSYYRLNVGTTFGSVEFFDRFNPPPPHPLGHHTKSDPVGCVIIWCTSHGLCLDSLFFSHFYLSVIRMIRQDNSFIQTCTYTQQTPYARPRLGQCWPSVEDVGPTLIQPWAGVWCLLARTPTLCAPGACLKSPRVPVIAHISRLSYSVARCENVQISVPAIYYYKRVA